MLNLGFSWRDLYLDVHKCNSVDTFHLGSLTFSHAWGEFSLLCLFFPFLFANFFINITLGLFSCRENGGGQDRASKDIITFTILMSYKSTKIFQTLRIEMLCNCDYIDAQEYKISCHSRDGFWLVKLNSFGNFCDEISINIRFEILFLFFSLAFCASKQRAPGSWSRSPLVSFQFRSVLWFLCT